MPHWRPFRVDAETPFVGFCLLFPAMTNPEFTTLKPVVLVPVTSYRVGSKLNMSPYFSVMPPW